MPNEPNLNGVIDTIGLLIDRAHKDSKPILVELIRVEINKISEEKESGITVAFDKYESEIKSHKHTKGLLTQQESRNEKLQKRLEKESGITVAFDKYESEIKSHKHTKGLLTQQETRNEKLQKQLDRLKSEKTDKGHTANNLQKEIQRLEELIIQKEKQIKQSESSISFDKHQTELDSHKRTKALLKQQEQKNDKLHKQLDEIKSSTKLTDDEVAKLFKEIDRLEGLIAQKNDEIQRIQTSTSIPFENYQAEIKSHKRTKDLLKQQEDTNSKLHRDLDDLIAIKVDNKSDLTLEVQIENFRKLLKDRDEEIKQLKNPIKHKDDEELPTAQDYLEAKMTIGDLENEVEALKLDNSNIKNDNEEKDKLIDNLKLQPKEPKQGQTADDTAVPYSELQKEQKAHSRTKQLLKQINDKHTSAVELVETLRMQARTAKPVESNKGQPVRIQQDKGDTTVPYNRLQQEIDDHKATRLLAAQKEQEIEKLQSQILTLKKANSVDGGIKDNSETLAIRRLEEQMSSIKAQNQGLEVRIKEAEKDAAKSRTTSTELKQNLDNTGIELEKLRAQSYPTQLKNLQKEHDEIRDELAMATITMKEQRVEIGKLKAGK